MCVWINFPESTPLLENTPQNGGLPVEVDQDSEVVLEALICLDNVDISSALGQLFAAGVRHGNRTGELAASAASCGEEATQTHLR